MILVDLLLTKLYFSEILGTLSFNKILWGILFFPNLSWKSYMFLLLTHIFFFLTENRSKKLHMYLRKIFWMTLKAQQNFLQSMPASQKTKWQNTSIILAIITKRSIVLNYHKYIHFAIQLFSNFCIFLRLVQISTSLQIII